MPSGKGDGKRGLSLSLRGPREKRTGKRGLSLSLRGGRYLCDPVATICVVAGVCLWIFVGSETGARFWPALAGVFPDRFWIIVLANLALLGLGYLISWLPRKGTVRDLTNLTVWTQKKRPSG